MVWSLVSSKGRRRLIRDASQSRNDAISLRTAWLAILLYNIVGGLDIYSTTLGLNLGAGEEANPLIRIAMENLGAGWVGAKLLLQLVISAMVVWFPHRIVLGIFLVAITFNAGIVYSNLKIAGVF